MRILPTTVSVALSLSAAGLVGARAPMAAPCPAARPTGVKALTAIALDGLLNGLQSARLLR